MKTDISTYAIKPNERFDYWKSAVCEHLITADARPENYDSFEGSFGFTSHAGVDVASLATSNHSWNRTAACIRTDPEDDLWLGFMELGEGVLEQNGHVTPIMSGQLSIYDAAKPFRNSYKTGGLHIVRLPRSRILERVPGVEQLAGTVLQAGRPGVAPLQQMLLECVKSDFNEEDPILTSMFAESLFEMICVALRFQRTHMDKANSSDPVYRRIRQFMTDNIGDHSLTLTSIAAEHHLTPRTLTRIFARHDQSPMSVLWQERLAMSKKALLTGKVRNITQLALSHGFSDMSHFSRVFRKNFGCSPTELVGRK